MREIMFVELANPDILTSGKPFEGLTHGTFVDMRGNRAKITKSALKQIVENTKQLISTTKTDSGELVGLPVDAQNHDNGDGAGWIKDVNLSESEDHILFSVDWTEVGYSLISKKIRRWFSATVSLTQKKIFGGTLTNWPAVRAKDGSHLLQPIELSQNMFELAEGGATTLQQIREIQFEFFESYDWWSYSISDIDLEENYLIARTGGKDYRVLFEFTDKGKVKLADEDSWKRVRNNWIDVVSDFADNLFNKQAPTKSKEEIEDTEELIMNDETRQEIQGLISEALTPLTELVSSLTPRQDPPADDETPAPNGNRDILNQIVNLDGMTEELGAEIQTLLMEQVDNIQRMATADFAKKLAETKREGLTVELCNDLTQGTEDTPRGIAVDGDELKKHLMQLDQEQYQYFTGLLKSIWRSGFVEYAELGHQKDMQGTVQLPDYLASQLRAGEITLDDLKDPILAPSVGDLSQYDLSEFKE